MWEVGVTIGCVGALISVSDYVFKFSQLSEKFATLRSEFAQLGYKYDEKSYQEKILLLQTCVLEGDIL